MRILTAPHPFQREDVQRVEALGGRCLLGHSMGLGKSLMSLAYAARNPAAWPVVVVCPATLKWNWQDQVRKHLGQDAAVLEHARPPRYFRHGKAGIVVVNYDILAPSRHGEGWVPYLQSLRPGLVIADECHALKDRKAARSKALRNLISNVPHFLPMSGTALVNRPAELFNVLNMLRPDLWPSFFPFAQAHCRPELKPWGWVYNGAEALDILHQKMSENCYVRRRKEDVLDQLPALVRSVIPLEIEDHSQYRQAEVEFLRWLRKHHGAAKAHRAAGAERLTQLSYLRMLAGKLKLNAVLQWVKDFLDGDNGKLIVFGVHRRFVETVHEHFKDRAVLVHGGTPGRARQLAFDQFNNDPGTRLFVGNLQAAGTGWSCTSASTVAIAQPPWTPGDATQAEARVEGIARGIAGVAAQIYYLVGRHTIESMLIEIITRKQRVLDAVLDGQAGVSEFNVFDQLEELYLRR